MKVGHVYPKEYEKVCNTVQRWRRLGLRQQKGLAHFLCHVYTFTKKNVTSHKKCARLCTTVLRIGRTIHSDSVGGGLQDCSSNQIGESVGVSTRPLAPCVDSVSPSLRERCQRTKLQCRGLRLLACFLATAVASSVAHTSEQSW